MDEIHGPEGRPWIGEQVKVGQYFEELKTRVKKLKPVQDTREISAKNMMKMMGMEDRELFTQLEDVMKVDNLTCEEEVEAMQISDPILDNIHGPDIAKFYKTTISPAGRRSLKTLCLQDEWLERTNIHSNNNKFKQRRIRQSKHDNDHWFTAEKPPSTKLNTELVDDAVVVVVRVYRPFRHLAPFQSYGQTSIKYAQEILLLGHHTLADLREKIWCPADMNAVGPQQVDTLVCPATRAGDVYKSGFFYIEGTFYNDFRDPNNIDYSEPIRNWGPPRGLGPFSTARIEEQRLDALTVRPGYPYLYQHQGNHEHIVSFIDMRLLCPEDPQNKDEYPLVRSLGSQMPRYCHVCQTSIAVWVCKNHSRVPEDPSFFCALCYKNFNFVGKIRRGSFKEYRYFDVNVI